MQSEMGFKKVRCLYQAEKTQFKARSTLYASTQMQTRMLSQHIATMQSCLNGTDTFHSTTECEIELLQLEASVLAQCMIQV